MEKYYLLVGLILFLLFVIYLITRKKSAHFRGIQNYSPDLGYIDGLFRYYTTDRQQSTPKKRVNKREEQCRTILQNIFKKPFTTIRPDWLKNPRTGRNLELDCYNAELGIALEFNGQQHYAYTPYFHRSKEDFFNQVHRDDWKRKKCQARGLKLIEIPYWVTDVDLESYIRKQLG